jgi:hypothetical protein
MHSAAPRSKKQHAGPWRATRARSDGASAPAMLIDFHEIAERYREDSLLRRGKRIDSEPIFQARDQNGESERVEPAIGKHQIVFQRREYFSVLVRDLLHLFHYG